jgi:hypothetical protein
MEKKLTDNQKSIINEITTEFAKINEQRKVKSNGKILNLSQLIKQKLDDEQVRKEIMLHNKGKIAELNEVVDDAVEVLNDELNGIGLMAYKRKPEGSSFAKEINIDTIENCEYNISKGNRENFKFSDVYTYIFVKHDSDYISFDSSIDGISKIKGFKSFELESNRNYTTIEEMLTNSDTIKRRLKNYIKENY